MELKEFEQTIADLILTTKWEWASNDGTCEVDFTGTHIVMKENLFPYIITFAESQNTLLLHLFKPGSDETLAILKYEGKKLRWFGRSFEGGYIQIVPGSNVHIWKKLDNPLKYMREEVLKQAPVNYIDEIPMDHIVPEYDIRLDFPDFDKIIHSECCVALIACDRLEYFIQCMQALALNSQAKEWPVFLFLDKPTDPSKDINSAQHIVLLKEYFPDSIVICRPTNFGAGKNIIDARRQLFDYLHFDYVFLIEDDVVVAPNYLETMVNLWSWLVKNNYKNNVGVIQGWQYNISEQPSSYVEINIDNLWAYSMSKECWDDIKDLVYQYEKDYLFSRYNERPHRTIFKWYDTILVSPIREGYPASETKLAVLKGSLNALQTNQESCVLNALYRRGWLRLNPKVNLAENIGRSGIGKSTDYDNMSFEAIKLQTADIESFEESL